MTLNTRLYDCHAIEAPSKWKNEDIKVTFKLISRN